MSVSDSEPGIAFEVALDSSPVEAFTKPPDLPRHLRIRMQTYVSTRPRKTINVRLEEAERRRQRQIARRAENARRAEERCRRIADAMEIVTDYNRHLKGDEVDGRPPKPSELKAVYQTIKEDLNAVIGRVDREAMQMIDRKYVHNPISYQPKRRNTHRDKCTCECCYLENKEKLASVQKNLAEVLIMDSDGMTSAEENFHLEIEEEIENKSPVEARTRKDPRAKISLSAELGFSSHQILDIPLRSHTKRHVSWADDDGCRDKHSLNKSSRYRSQACHASLAVGPDSGIQTDDVCCPSCDALQNLRHLTRAMQTQISTADVSCQTDPEQFSCHCCHKHL